MIVALAGGVGGAKLADGLCQILGTDLAVVVNTGDDFEHLGLHIAPDLDTVLYTLAGIANPETGWGVAQESWTFLEQLQRLGGPGWFRLGDRDMAIHVLRSAALRAGWRLTEVTVDFRRRLGIAAQILPMSDDPVRTVVRSVEGELAFQDYFVGRQCAVAVTGFRFEGVEKARPSVEVAAVLAAPELEAIVLCPSNPYVSIDPILAVPGMRGLVARAGVPVVAVSPIIGGSAVKGPAAKMMRELGLDPSAATVAAHYRGLAGGMVLDDADAGLAEAVAAEGMAVKVTRTLMQGRDDRRRLAEECVAFARSLRPSSSA
jgi:LPPG:FO 2-phospho-L-lactate transferase